MTIHIGHHSHHHHQPSPLDVGEMAAFDDTLDECDDEERKRRRIVYMKDAIQNIHMGKSVFKAFGCLLIPFAIIPIFWPMLGFMYFIMKKQRRALDQQLTTALEYWQLDLLDVDPEMSITSS